MAGNVTGIILLFLGGFFLMRGLRGVTQLVQALSWQRVPGTMVGSGVAGYQTQASGGHLGANMQRAVFAYTYQVDGHTYTGQRAALGAPLGFATGLGVASAQASRYTPGQQVDVWVDPRNPANSVLRRSAPSSIVFVVLGIALFAAGAFSLGG